MTTKIVSKKNAGHYKWAMNCDSWVLADTEGLSVKQEIMPTGEREQLHFHETASQFFFILKGTATFLLDGEKLLIGEQEGILIEPLTKHYIANETGTDLEFLVISQPTTKNDRTTIRND